MIITRRDAITILNALYELHMDGRVLKTEEIVLASSLTEHFADLRASYESLFL